MMVHTLAHPLPTFVVGSSALHKYINGVLTAIFALSRHLTGHFLADPRRPLDSLILLPFSGLYTWLRLDLVNPPSSSPEDSRSCPAPLAIPVWDCLP